MFPNFNEELMTILFKMQGYTSKKIYKESKGVIIEVDKLDTAVPIDCLFPHTRYDSSIQDILIGICLGRPIYARLRVYRIKCSFCGIYTESHVFYEGKKRYSKSIGSDIVRYTELLDNKSVSKLFGISTSMVYRIDRDVLSKMEEHYTKRMSLTPILSIDEVSYKRRHKYATVITNYSSAKVLWLEKGRKQIDLERGYKKFVKGHEEVKTVAMDFWKAYENATRAKIPNATIVYDRFHLSRILNDKIEKERREYQNSLDPDERKLIKKHCRWLILKRRKNLSDENMESLDQLKSKNEPLYEIYLLKEDFLEIFDPKKDRDEARSEILGWIETVLSTKYKKLIQFARSVEKRLDIILNWFDSPISNAKSEGLNNVIKTLLKRAYGYKDFDYFRSKVLQKCGLLMTYLPREI